MSFVSRIVRRATAANVHTTSKVRFSTIAPCTTLTEDEQMLQESVSAFANETVAPLVTKMDETCVFPPELHAAMFNQGLLGMEIESQYGGLEASFFNVTLAIEALSRVDPVVGLVCDLQNTVINNVFCRYGTPEQKAQYLPALASDTIGSFCLSEAGSGSDAFALSTTATLNGDNNYVLSGQKMWISNAEYANIFLVFATVDKNAGYKGITCFIVEKSSLDDAASCLEIGAPENKMGIRASSTCPVYFNDLVVPASNVLGNVGEGYKIAISTLNEGRIGIAAQMLGLAHGVMFDKTLPYLYERKQFGSMIGDFQGMSHQVATLATEIEATRLLVYNTARMKDAGQDFVKQAAMAKLQASQVAEKTASKCIEWMGGLGFTKDAGVEKYFRDSKVGAIYEGTSNMQLNTIAKIIRSEYI